MDMRWGFQDGHFYLLTYGDGFFNINPDAAMTQVRATSRAPEHRSWSLDADPTDGPAPLTVQFSSEGTHDPDPADSITVRVGLRRRRHDRFDRSEPDPSTYTAIGGSYTATPDRDRLERQEHVGEHDDHRRQHLARR